MWGLISSRPGSSSESNPSRQQGRTTTTTAPGGRRGSQVKNSSGSPPVTIYENRSLLQDFLLKSHEEPHLDSVSQLGRLCLEEAHNSRVLSGNDLIYCAALLLEWSCSRGDELSPIYYRRSAGAHYEAWKTRGVIGEVLHSHSPLAHLPPPPSSLRLII